LEFSLVKNTTRSVWQAASLRGLVVLVGIFLATAATASNVDDKNEDILRMVNKIKADQSEESRINLADDLAISIARMKVRSDVSGASIDAIASLLSDSSDAVRGAAAWAISYFGSRAEPSMPLLVQALARIEQAESKSVVKGESTSELPICSAMLKIGNASRLPFRCRFLLGLEMVKTVPVREATIFIARDRTSSLMNVLKQFADDKKFVFSSETSQISNRQVYSVSIQIDHKSRLQADSTHETGVFELVAYSVHGEDAVWQPEWDRLMAILSSTFGPNSIRRRSL
jgi:hypothetical protein